MAASKSVDRDAEADNEGEAGGGTGAEEGAKEAAEGGGAAERWAAGLRSSPSRGPHSSLPCTTTEVEAGDEADRVAAHVEEDARA